MRVRSWICGWQWQGNARVGLVVWYEVGELELRAEVSDARRPPWIEWYGVRVGDCKVAVRRNIGEVHFELVVWRLGAGFVG